jgi:hypothetical protein
MERLMDRRSIFFTAAGGICALMIPLAPADLRWVPAWLALAYVVLAFLSVLDHLSSTHEDRRSKRLNRSDR